MTRVEGTAFVERGAPLGTIRRPIISRVQGGHSLTDSPLVVGGSQPSAVASRSGPLGMDWPRPLAMVLIMIGLFTLLRVAAAAFVGLGTDESYSVAVARDLNLSYFDHPPMHYWLAHAVEPLAGVGRGDRGPFIALFAGSSLLMFLLTRRLFGEAAGVWAALALNLSGFFTLAAGSWVLPDGPLIFGLLAAATILAEHQFAASPSSSQSAAARPLLAWLAVGVCVGLAGLSKYQAALFCVGLGLYLITTSSGRRRLLEPGPYLAAAAALIVLSPVLVWNANHHWASFAFQAGRGAPGKFRPLGPLSALLGQAALLLPWIFVPTVGAVIAAARKGPADERGWFCLMLAAPAIGLFTLTPLFGPLSLPHWSMPGWLLLFPLLGDLLARAARRKPWPVAWAAAAFAFILIVGAAAADDAASGWLGQRFPSAFRRGDPTAESIEWSQLRGPIAREPVVHQPGAFIAALKWNEAGKVDQAAGDLAPVAVISDDPRQFAYRHPLAGFVGGDALIVGRIETVKARWADLSRRFQSVSMLPPVAIGRDGHGEILVGLALGRGLLASGPLPPGGRR